FLTPTFVLLPEVSGGNWRLVGVRVEDTLIGAALAVAGARLLWPRRGRDPPPGRPAQLLAGPRRHPAPPPHAPQRGDATAPAVAAARRRVGLGLNNAEASFERILAEPARAPLEPSMTLLFYTRRFDAAVGAFASARERHALAVAPALAPLWRELD